jgi:hypothetical protein
MSSTPTVNQQWTAAADKLVADVWRDLERTRRNEEFERAKADPAKHALTKVMDGHNGYTIWPVSMTPRGKRVRKRVTICSATNPNAAGNYLIWREVETFHGKKWKQTERFDWKYAGTKKEARALAERWSTRLKTT